MCIINNAVINGKKGLLLLVAMVMTVCASAQMMRSFDVKGNFRSDFGIGIGVTMNLIDQLDFAPAYNYYFRSGPNAWNIDADFHYTLKVAPRWEAYPLAGLTYYYRTKGRLGANVGAGCNYDFDMLWRLKVEIKYQVIKDWDDLFVSIGMAYKF